MITTLFLFALLAVEPPAFKMGCDITQSSYIEKEFWWHVRGWRIVDGHRVYKLVSIRNGGTEGDRMKAMQDCNRWLKKQAKKSK